MPDIPDRNVTPDVTDSDFVKNDIPAETDDLQLGQRSPDAPAGNSDADSDGKPRGTGDAAIERSDSRT